MNFIESIKQRFFPISEANGAPNPVTKLVSPYGYSDERPAVSFKDKIYYHSISPQLQVGVTGYARLLDLGNIMINSDDEASKKLIEEWIDNTNFKTNLENMGNTFLICGNAILEKLDENRILDVAEVDMNTIIDKKRDEFGNLLYYIQQGLGGQKKLGEGKTSKFIEFNLNTISRQAWSPCIFESAAIPRQVGNRVTKPLVELVVAMEDAMSTIVLNNAYPEVYYTFENTGEAEIKKEMEKIRKRKPGDRIVTTKQPKIDLFEAKGQSAYVDYIKYLYTSLELAVKFPVGILTGDFTSRASSETTGDLTVKLANAIKRYIGTKLKNELFDPILQQNGKNPKTANLQITFGTQEIIKLTPEVVGQRVVNGQWTKAEGREWDKDNAGVDLFDDDVIKQNELDAKNDLIPVLNRDTGKPEMKPRIISKESIKKKLRLKEDFGDTVVYRLDYGHDKEDECDNYSDEIYDLDASDMPELPIHPNCKCYFEDEETGEYLGQDPLSAVRGDVSVPESVKNDIKKEAVGKFQDIQKRAKEIKKEFKKK